MAHRYLGLIAIAALLLANGCVDGTTPNCDAGDQCGPSLDGSGSSDTSAPLDTGSDADGGTPDDVGVDSPVSVDGAADGPSDAKADG